MQATEFSSRGLVQEAGCQEKGKEQISGNRTERKGQGWRDKGN